MTFQTENHDGYPGQPDPGLALPPWEERERFGFLNALYLTVREVLFAPVRFFTRMPTRIGLAQPLLFAIVVGALGAFFVWMWSLAFSSLQIFFQDNLGEVLREPIIYGLAFALSPVLTIIEVFLTAGITHVCLMITGGNRLGFEATFRVIAYSQAVSILTILPLCGIVILEFWYLMLVVIGLHRAHETDLWRAVLAVFFPLLFCLASCGGLALLLAGVGVLSG